MPNESNFITMYMYVLRDIARMVPDYTQYELNLDLSYVRRRVNAEGLSFLVKTMPSLGKEIDLSFETGTFVPHPAFRRERGRTTPVFLRVLFKAVYEDCGTVRSNPCPEAVGHIRQLCYMFYKLEDEYAPELVSKVIDDFVTVDAELANLDLGVRELRPLIIEAKKIINAVFRGFQPRDIIPRPGPGASASGTPSVLRYEPLVLWDQVHQVFPYYEYFYTGKDHLLDRVHAYRRLPRRPAPSSMLRCVPKDSRGPRIICMEEQEVMFLQQGLADKMRSRIENHPLTKGRVNFTDQTVNQRLAQRASCNDLSCALKATLDMKEASDRVSRELVSVLFEDLTLLKRALLALSTRNIVLPSGEVVNTLKFAPMGSSLCFPVMSIVHYALGMAAIKLHAKRGYTALADSLHVYGDDIIVDTPYAAVLFEQFPKFGLKFNIGKSFTRGPFRESCGFDAFLGKNVAPQRIKKRFFNSADPRLVAAGLDCEGHLFSRGYLYTAEYLRTVLLKSWTNGEPLPFVPHGSGALGWRRTPEHCDLSLLRSRRNHDLQSREYKVCVMETKSSISFAGCWERLLRSTTGVSRSQTVAGAHDKHIIRWTWVPESSFLGYTENKWSVQLG